MTPPSLPSPGVLECHYRIVRLAARVRLQPDEVEQLGEALGHPDLDWPYLVRYASYHGSLALLYAHLRDHYASRVPGDILEAMRGVVLRRSVWALTLTQELARLERRFEDEGIRALALKGPTLAQRVYESLALRPFVDLDLLVRRQDYDRLETLLITEGYDRRELTPIQKATYLLVHAQYTFGRARESAYPATLDIHTSVVPLGYSYAATFDELWERSQAVTIGGGRVPTLQDEDLLIVLCYHGFKNRWDRFKYITDVREVIHAFPGLDWGVIERRADGFQGRRVLHLGLLLAHTLLGAELPPHILAAARADRRVLTLHDEVIGRLPEEAHIAVEPYWDRVRLNLYGQDRWTGRVRYGGYSLLRRMSELVLPDGEA